MKDLIDKAIKEAEQREVTPIAIKLTFEQAIVFEKEMVKTMRYLIPFKGIKRYCGIRLIEGYKLSVGTKLADSGLLCVSIFNDYGIFGLKELFIPFETKKRGNAQ